MNRHKINIVLVLFGMACAWVLIMAETPQVSPSSRHTISFRGYGLSFNYADAMRLDNVNGIVPVITVKDAFGSKVVFSIYKKGVLKKEELISISQAGFQRSTSRSEHSVNLQEDVSKRTILGKSFQGTKFTDVWNGEKRITEFFVIEISDKMLAISLQHLSIHKEQAEISFGTIFSSLSQVRQGKSWPSASASQERVGIEELGSEYQTEKIENSHSPGADKQDQSR